MKFGTLIAQQEGREEARSFLEPTMETKAQLNLVGIPSPLCLLECNTCLRRMGAGEILEVLVQDPEVADILVTIIQRSDDTVMDRQRVGRFFQISIRKR